MKLIRCLVNVLFIAFIISFITVVQSAVITNISNNANNVNFLSQDDELDDSIAYAAQMIAYMNMTANPCDDFYDYACGNWKNVIGGRQAHQHKRNNLLDIIYKLMNLTEIMLLKSNIDDLAPQYTTEFQLMQKFYNNCLYADLYPLQKSKKYLDVVQSIGGFPALDRNWQPENFSWLNMSAYLSNYGIDGLVSEIPTYQYPFSPYFTIPKFGFDIDLHFDNIAVNNSNAKRSNKQRMRELLLAYKLSANHIDETITEIFDFLQSILQVVKEFDEDLDKCHKKLDIYELRDDVEYISMWKYYSEIAWRGQIHIMDLDDESYPCAYFYKQLNEICNRHKQAVANYLSLRFLHFMDARLQHRTYQKEYCLLTIQQTFPYLIDELYMKMYFSTEIEAEVRWIIKAVRQSLRKMLAETDWLDEVTRKAALIKESKIVVHVGRYEDQWLIDRLVREMRNLLPFVSKDFTTNNLALKRFKTYMKRYKGLHSIELSNITKPSELLIGMQVNSFYYNLDNAIYMMAGNLHPPCYHKSWPNSLKFGTVGYLIGHEFIHGFDSVGANYDGMGNLHYWWSRKSGKVFNERSKCYVEHYQKYVIPEINRNINGNITKDENIADAGGLRYALMAYRNFLYSKCQETNPLMLCYKSEQMPGLQLSPEQLFFLGFAQLWCSSYEEAQYWQELSNEHSIDKYRVLGTLTNMAEFSKVYNCPLGSKMNPTANKCLVW